DGIRDFHVTGVQTCALPIYVNAHDQIAYRDRVFGIFSKRESFDAVTGIATATAITSDSSSEIRLDLGFAYRYAKGEDDGPYPSRSEERRVGNDCRFCRALG